MDRTARLGFAGTPDFAATILARLLEGGYRPTVVYSQPARPRGRGRNLVKSPVAELAEQENIAVETPRSLKPAEAQQALHAYRLDLLIVAAYGLLLPAGVLTAPRLGCLNVHASLLPRWRGAAPIERALLAGDETTGVALMQMDEGLDTGPVHTTLSLPITATMTGGELESALAKAGGDALLELLTRLEDSVPVSQPTNGACYAHKLTAADSLIDWRQDAAQIERQVRALLPRQPATATLGDLRLRVLGAAIEPATPSQAAPGTILALDKGGLLVQTGTGGLRLSLLQLNRGKGQPLDGAALRNGYAQQLAPGVQLDTDTRSPHDPAAP